MAEIIVTETDELSIKDSPSEEPRQTYPYWKSEEQRRRLVRLALGFEGTPYVSGGITADGIDCSGLTYIVYKMFGTSIPRTVVKQFEIGKKIDRTQLEEGDLLFFNGGDKPLHVGIYIGGGRFLHASTSKKQVRQDYVDTGGFKYRHFVGAVRVRELREARATR